MRNLAHRLISEEHRLGGLAGSEGHAALQVCDKLRELLSELAGTRGFRTLLVRALTLAKAETAWLGRLEVAANGSLMFPAELEREVTPTEAAEGGAALVGHLLELLGTLVGETITRRLVQQVWPKVAFGDSKPGGKT